MVDKNGNFMLDGLFGEEGVEFEDLDEYTDETSEDIMDYSEEEIESIFDEDDFEE